MKIIFSDHAKLKIQQRKLAVKSMLETIAHPDFTQPGYHTRIELFKKFGKRYLKVVIVRTMHTVIVVTAHWIVKLPKKHSISI